jgi:hypothetical protein
MFEPFQIVIGITIAIAAFFLGVGLAIGGWIAKAQRMKVWGIGFALAGVLIVVLACVAFQKVDWFNEREFWTHEKAAEKSPEVQRLRWIEHADVIADFRQNVEQKHDTRFVTVYGLSFGTEFPGLEDTPEMQQLVKQHGARRLESGSDVFNTSLEMELTHQIFDYARRYNSLLLGYLEHEK